MASYKLLLKRSAERELRKITQLDLRRVVKAIQALAQEPRPPGARMLRGPERWWRIRQGDYRIIYEIDDATAQIAILKIGHRREVYGEQ